MRPLRVFLCHASQDKPAVWRLHRYLTQHGVKPWLDQEDLLPGEDWEVEIPNAIFSSDVILVCLSKNSVNKEGMVQKEISFALDKALEKPGKIFIIPVKLEECDIPKRLSRYQWVEYYRTDGRKRLLMGLNKRVTELGEEVMPVVVEDTRQRTPRPQSPKPKIKKPEEQIASVPVLEDLKEESKNETPAKPFTKLLDPSTLSPQKVLSTKADKQYEKKRLLYGLGGFALIAVFVLGLYSLFPLSSGQHKTTLTPTFLEYTETPKPPTAISATFTSTSQPIKTPSPAPTLGIGSTMISEKDGMVLVYVPEGEFTMGREDDNLHTVSLEGFWIDQTEITNKMYAMCVDEGECDLPTAASRFSDSSYTDYPVVNIDWKRANVYCSWANRRLPSEAEWEKAMRSDDRLSYSSSADDSPYGAYELAGNVWEWTSSLYMPYPYEINDGRENLGSDGDRVLRGGTEKGYSITTSRTYLYFYQIWDSNGLSYGASPPNDLIGFRCAHSP